MPGTWTKDHLLFGTVLNTPYAYPPLQRAPNTRAQIWVAAQKFLEDRNRPQTRGRLQHREHLSVENIRKRVWATPATLSLLLGRQDRIGLQAIAGRLTEASLGSGHGNGTGLSERHEKPHLLISDMAARHERSPKNGTIAFYPNRS